MLQKFATATLFLFFLTTLLHAADQPQWGQSFSRNMISSEKKLPDSFDIETGRNIKWKAKLGSQTYSTPVIANGKVFIGTNNDDPRDTKYKGDKGVLYCLNEKDGSLIWQLVVPKVRTSKYWDWPREGICSPATVEGDFVYIVSNRGEVMCLDINGLADGNAGPFKDEAKLLAEPGEPPLKLSKTDADIIWVFDMISELNVRQHDGAHSSLLTRGNYIYANTSNGVDDEHQEIHSPDAPSLIVLDKRTGKRVAQDDLKIGNRIFHSTWSSPTLGTINGKNSILFGGGDGILYAFDAVSSPKEKLIKLWNYDGDPTAPKDSVHKYMKNREISPSNIKSMPVFKDNRVYLTLGGDIWWGKRTSWLKCIDTSTARKGISPTELWSFEMTKHCCATPAISNGLVFVGDTNKEFHCLDANTGEPYWSHTLNGDVWASALVADGKVYIGTRRGDFWIFEASEKKNILFQTKFDDEINATTMAANGVLYVATMEYLYAIAK
jgi:outer membrane protein assembly factor BamB